MKVLFVLELGLLHYRIPIFERIANDRNIEQCDVIHTEAYTGCSYSFTELKSQVKPLGNVKFLPEVRKIKNNYDIIIFSFNLWRPNWLYTLFSAKKAKYILWGQGFGRTNNYLAARLVKICFAHWADALIFYTASGRQDFKHFGISEDKMFVAQNTLHVNNSGPTTSAEKKDLLYVGRIQERKGVDEFIKAFSLIVKAIPDDINIRIVGNGNTAHLEEVAVQYHVQDRVIFEPGAFDETQLKEKFSRAIAYVSPNHVGLGVVHSFAYGVPVITNRNRKHAPEFEYCNSSNSILYDGETEELSTALKEICNNRSLQKAFSVASFNYYDKHLRTETMVKGFLNAFDYVLNCDTIMD